MYFNLMKVVNAVAPSYATVQAEIDELKKFHPNYDNKKLSKKLSAHIIHKYTSIGVVSALPSAIPGLGTVTQLAIEGGSISADLALLMRWATNMCIGIGMIYGHNMQKDFNTDFLKIIGLWCGAIYVAKGPMIKLGQKVAIAQFNKRVTGKMLGSINRRVSTTILTKYGTKRGGIALGKIIPFGVGGLVGGGFNYFTMKGISKAAIDYYEDGSVHEYVVAG